MIVATRSSSNTIIKTSFSHDRRSIFMGLDLLGVQAIVELDNFLSEVFK